MLMERKRVLAFFLWLWCLLVQHSWNGVNSDTVLECNLQWRCSGEQVQCQCIVSDSPILLWRIKDENHILVATETYSSGDSSLNSSQLSNAPAFSTDLSSTSPIKSKILYTLQSSINGYTIQCSDNKGNNTNHTILIQDFPSAPKDICVSINRKSINVTWTPPTLNSACVVKYTVTSNITTANLVTTTDTSVPIPLGGLSPNIYCVSVAAVDTANRTGEYSEEECFELNVFPPPLVTWNRSVNVHSIIFTIHLTFNGSVVPPVTNVFVVFTPDPISKIKIDEIKDDVFTVQFTADRNVASYIVLALAENALGNGSASIFTINIDSFPISTSNSFFPTLIPSSSFVLTPSSTPDQPQSSNLVAIIAPVGVIALLVVIIVLGLLIYCVYKCCMQISGNIQNRRMQENHELQANQQQQPNGYINSFMTNLHNSGQSIYKYGQNLYNSAYIWMWPSNQSGGTNSTT